MTFAAGGRGEERGEGRGDLISGTLGYTEGLSWGAWIWSRRVEIWCWRGLEDVMDLEGDVGCVFKWEMFITGEF